MGELCKIILPINGKNTKKECLTDIFTRCYIKLLKLSLGDYPATLVTTRRGSGIPPYRGSMERSETFERVPLFPFVGGVVHPQIQCEACSNYPIKGIRWKCSDCDDFDLCDPCYIIYKHAKSHSFLRIDAAISRPHYVEKTNVHVHIECDGCGDCPIKGTRWKCSDCDDFDLCNPCYIIKKHVIRHSFLQIDAPNSRSANCSVNKPFDLFSMAHIRGLHRKLKIDEGVVHPQIQCDACSDCPIKGIRWKCSDCDDFDLCDPCYTIYKHAKSHSFLRIDAAISRPHHMGKINVHVHIECDGCGDCPIKGTRWKCSDCDDFDLCDHCYIITKHTIRHSFLQIDAPNSRSVATTRKCIGTPPEWEIMGRSEYHGTLQ
ncbi:uncharacterized protein LOC133182833 [Saccostrea echinata]|uniref:uncharacterized protein LOC133182833 n=1 Tax=Saccostrea echinata TaxID=191078 RepID=UPI002A7F1868|nr:uncharacterized protein LOC133182833 [Saccostrea echinata]